MKEKSVEEIIEEAREYTKKVKVASDDLFSIAASGLARGHLDDQVLSELEKANDASKEPINQVDVEDIFNAAKQWLVTRPKKNKKDKEDNLIYTSFLETNEYILEQINIKDTLDTLDTSSFEASACFLKYWKLEDKWETVNEFESKGKVYRPIIDETYLKGGVKLPSGIEEYKDNSELINQMREYVHYGAELPVTPVDFERFFPYLTQFYWIYEKFPFVPYIHFIGGTGTGKSSITSILGSICYKPIDTTGSLTIASVFRLATKWRGTLLIDEFNSIGENQKEMISFLKSGVSDRLVFRTEGEGAKEVKVYVVKSPKIFNSETPIDDAGLQSRTIVIEMDKSTRELPLFLLPKYEEEAAHIRNKLLLWRLRNYNKVDLTKIEFGFPELKIFDRRVQQVVTPIYYFSDESGREEVIKFAKDHEQQTLKERQQSIEGKIFEIIWDRFQTEEQVTLFLIAGIINKNRKNPYQETSLGRIVNRVLNLKTHRQVIGDSKETVVDLYDDPSIKKKIEAKAKYYGFNGYTEGA